MVYRELSSQVAAVLLGMRAARVSWATQLVSYFPGSGLFWDITSLRLVQVLMLAGSPGLLAPMQVYVLHKGKWSMASMSGNLKTQQKREALVCSRTERWAESCAGHRLSYLLRPTALPRVAGTAWSIGKPDSHPEYPSGAVERTAFSGESLFYKVALLLLAQNVAAACVVLPQASAEKRDPADEIASMLEPVTHAQRNNP
jgi:hypothetical protein